MSCPEEKIKLSGMPSTDKLIGQSPEESPGYDRGQRSAKGPMNATKIVMVATPALTHITSTKMSKMGHHTSPKAQTRVVSRKTFNIATTNSSNSNKLSSKAPGKRDQSVQIKTPSRGKNAKKDATGGTEERWGKVTTLSAGGGRDLKMKRF